ncbi:alpha/beta hydrolase [Variovorax sp. J22R24]|uniref:alpha/beta fold hydrolase n=1 Tax=Variovorax gracilis TaxID=3053502 RepID=UPI00257923D8|nr:alpha/beta hydrolase [Variovorax sp. J22R24]MDM0104474.1 alpha/beta hydrolase [Variovorax sp. J22R24]
MAGILVGRENTKPIELHYEDHGSGPPVVLIHGWPLGSECWEKQIRALLDAGHRVIAYDRRGFGQSSRAISGYDYDTLAEDLDRLLEVLDLHDAALIGYGMGAGEVMRYLGTFGSDRVSRAVLVAALPPLLFETDSDPDGPDRSAFNDMRTALEDDRPAFLRRFLERACNFDELAGTLVSEDSVRARWIQAIHGSVIGTLEGLAAWLTDFRDDVRRIDVPMLVIHGDADRVYPLHLIGPPLSEGIPGARLVVLRGAPHGLLWTHAPQVNAELIRFLASLASR